MHPKIIKNPRTTGTRTPAEVSPRARPRFRPEIECLESRIIRALTQVTDTSSFPWRAVVDVEGRYPDGWGFTGSGTVIENNHVLTAAHLLYRRRARRLGLERHGVRRAQRRLQLYATANAKPGGLTIYSAFKNHEDNYNRDGNHYSEEGDMGLIALSTNLGDSTGTFGYASRSESFLQGQQLYSAGYPGESYDGNHLYQTSGYIDGTTSEAGWSLLEWDNYSWNDSHGFSLFIGGQSGSPIYFKDSSNNRYVVGIFVSALEDNTWGHAFQITSDVFSNIQDWISRDTSGGSGSTRTTVGGGGGGSGGQTNHPPVAYNDSYTVNQNNTLSVYGSGVLGNDYDSDGNTLSAYLGGYAAHGTVSLNTDGSFSYTPYYGYTGTDSFSYYVSDGQATSNYATVSLTVNAVNHAPVAYSDSCTVDQNKTLNVSGSGSPGQRLRQRRQHALRLPGWVRRHGTVSLNTDGSFSYTPYYGYTGTDNFSYYVSDGQTARNYATVSLTINSANHPPVAYNDYYTVDQNKTLNVSGSGALANDYDQETFFLSAVLNTNPTHGTVSFNSDGSFAYIPQTGFAGTDSFTYYAFDGSAYSASAATVSITVNAGSPRRGRLRRRRSAWPASAGDVPAGYQRCLEDQEGEGEGPADGVPSGRGDWRGCPRVQLAIPEARVHGSPSDDD